MVALEPVRGRAGVAASVQLWYRCAALTDTHADEALAAGGALTRVSSVPTALRAEAVASQGLD